MSCRSSTTADSAGYEENARATFARLKQAGDRADVIATEHGALVPVGERHTADAELIESLTRWREAAAFAFPAQATVTPEGTARWMRLGLLDAPDRMLWLVLDGDGRAVGHAGFANALNTRRELELDNVVRGEPGAPGAMSAAVRALTGWARAALRPATISLRVFADNEHALAFYRALGWEERRRIPLRLVHEDSWATYEEADDHAPPDREFVRMELRETPR